MKTIEVKGKPYVPVNERILHLAASYKHRYSIDTNYVFYPDLRMWVVKAVLTITDENGNLQSFTGLAQETESDNYKQVNYTSALENAETSAIGRACAAAGVGITGSYASADEVQKANNRHIAKKAEEAKLPVLDNAKGLASVKQKRDLVVLLAHDCVSEEEKQKMIISINKLTAERAEQAIWNLKHKIKQYDIDHH